ncbi:MAG: DUF6580 family putative transport protein [Planctomycetaceae bacterium]
MRPSSIRGSTLAIACLYTVALRLAPYALMRMGVPVDPNTMLWPWNFSPALAVFLFGGALLPQRSASLLLPLGVYFASDLGIGLISGHWDWAFYPQQWTVYVAVALCAALGWLLRGRRSWGGIAACAFSAPWIFFFITNAGAWLGNSRYPQNLAGLIECYTAGLLHHRNLLLSTMLFSGLLFSPLGVTAADGERTREPLVTV